MAEELPWPDRDYGEDHAQYTALTSHPDLSGLSVEDGELLYVHRRHDQNASLSHRHNLWQGVLPLQIGGAEAMDAAALVVQLLKQPRPLFVEDDDGEQQEESSR